MKLSLNTEYTEIHGDHGGFSFPALFAFWFGHRGGNAAKEATEREDKQWSPCLGY